MYNAVLSAEMGEDEEHTCWLFGVISTLVIYSSSGSRYTNGKSQLTLHNQSEKVQESFIKKLFFVMLFLAEGGCAVYFQSHHTGKMSMLYFLLGHNQHSRTGHHQ